MLILGGNQLAGGFAVDNSCRFNDGSSDHLTRNPASAGNRKTFTFSAWCKFSNTTTSLTLFHAEIWSTTPWGLIQRQSDNTIRVRFYDGANDYNLITNRLFRDVSAWYHVVVAVDTTQATSSNRIKLYINGTQETSFATATYPTQNYDTAFNNTVEHQIGEEAGLGNYFDGYMAEVCLIDGTALDPTSFGEFDEDTGIWKPISVSGLTFGTNGFYLPFQNSAALGQDDSGNGNNWTVNNLTSIDQTTDTPTNNYATLNPNMAYPSTSITISDGNLDVIRTAGTAWENILSTFAPSSGKWYTEVKVTGVGSNGVNIGFANIDVSNRQNLTNAFGEDANSAGIYSASGAIFYNSGTTFATVGSYTAGDIIQLAMDIDNGYLYWGKNGTWLNSSDPESGATGTGGLALSNLTLGGSYAMGVSLRNSGDVTWNFGNPAFTISSGNSDGNGYGNFEYSVPSGYYALNTKNLAEFG